MVSLPAAALASCALNRPNPRADTHPIDPKTPAAPDGAPAPGPQPAQFSPQTSGWKAGPGEVLPEVKQTATAFIESAGTWRTARGARASLNGSGAAPQTPPTASILEVPGAESSSVQVVYPQYGGITTDTAAVIVLFDQQLRGPGGITNRQLALDVRLLRRATGMWEVDRINPLTSLGSSVPLSAAATEVLTDHRIRLSSPAQTDVNTGRVDEQILQILLGLAEDYELGIQVIHTGHIQTVFPTSRVSNHAVGRAVDIREIDGKKVIDPTMSPSVLECFMQRASELGATEVGGPFDLNAERKGFFTDDVHRDHIHIGVTPGDPLAHLR